MTEVVIIAEKSICHRAHREHRETTNLSPRSLCALCSLWLVLYLMRTYLNLMQHVLEHGTKKSDRTGTGTVSVFGYQMRLDLAQGFPLLTTKKVHLRSIIHELLWFLKGETNIKYLKENGVSIWNEWADAQGNLGPVYGYQWRSWPAPAGRHFD